MTRNSLDQSLYSLANSPTKVQPYKYNDVLLAVAEIERFLMMLATNLAFYLAVDAVQSRCSHQDWNYIKNVLLLLQPLSPITDDQMDPYRMDYPTENHLDHLTYSEI